MELGSLISNAMGAYCSADEYLTGDNSLPVCIDIDGDDWDENWLNSLTEHEGGDEDEDEDEEEDLDIDLPPPPPKIQTYKQAIESLEDIMEQHGQIELA